MRAWKVAGVVLGIGGLTALCIFLLLFDAQFELFEVPGQSMSPTIPPGSIVSVRAIGPEETLRHDDLVTFLVPGFDRTAVKRIIGLPGDSIEFRRGRLVRNQEQIDEPYTVQPNESSKPEGPTGDPITAPPQSIYVLGDNRTDSHDSRFFGPVPRSSVLGRVIAVGRR